MDYTARGWAKEFGLETPYKEFEVVLLTLLMRDEYWYAIHEIEGGYYALFQYGDKDFVMYYCKQGNTYCFHVQHNNTAYQMYFRDDTWLNYIVMYLRAAMDDL